MLKRLGFAALALAASFGTAQAADCAREFGPQTNVAALLACITEVNAEVEEIRRLSIRTGLPKNAVLAFDDPNGCPAGWTPYTRADGRVIIGVTTGKSPLSQRFYGEEGGAEGVTLNEAEMPAHAHGLSLSLGEGLGNSGQDWQLMWYDSTAGKVANLVASNTARDGAPTPLAGDGQPHENMPPFIALFYCKKD